MDKSSAEKRRIAPLGLAAGFMIAAAINETGAASEWCWGIAVVAVLHTHRVAWKEENRKR